MGWGAIISKSTMMISALLLLRYEIKLLRRIVVVKTKIIGYWSYCIIIGVLAYIVGEGIISSAIKQASVILIALGITMYVHRIIDLTIKLNNLANRDTLTGLINRRCLYNKLNKDLKYEENVSVLFLDIDDFKSINDNIGHINADKVLRSVTDEIQANLRDTDILSRFGGDEFVIILPNTNKETAYMILNRLQESVANLNFKGGVKVSFSGGVASSPVDGTCLEELICAADEEMYRVKKLNNYKKAF